MNEDQIKIMVDRFLGWKLPENFNPDGGISFERVRNKNTPWPRKNEPTGTNLLDADQAEAMVRYMVEGIVVDPAEKPSIMQPHQERVVIEKSELDAKIEKLDEFRAGEIFSRLPEEEKDRLNRQLSYMRSYSGVLADRISAF